MPVLRLVRADIEDKAGMSRRRMRLVLPHRRGFLGEGGQDAAVSFAADGSLTITISHAEPTDEVARANWLPAPDGQFALIVRTYVPTQPVLDGSYKLA
jgi:hypothetical protein